MKTNVLVASVVGAIVSFFLGWAVYGIALMGFFIENTKHYEGLFYTQPDLLMIFLSGLAMSWLLAYIFDKWANANDFMTGFKTSIPIILPIAIGMDLYWYGAMDLFNAKLIVVDIIVAVIFNGIIAGIIATVLGKMRKPAS